VIFSLISGMLSIVVVVLLAVFILRRDKGNEQMQEISHHIREGARTFLIKEYSVVFPLVFFIAIVLSVIPLFGINVGVNWKTAVAFVFGAFVSAFAGWTAMSVSTNANNRTAEAARSNLKEALKVSFSAGSSTGLSIVGFALIGLIIIYYVFRGEPNAVNGYAMGASLLALFARAGGGIFTKGADMGADLVGKVEQNIPEDDPRNAAVIADNVGDNVGDTAGLGADLLESYVESIIATLAIGYTLVHQTGFSTLSHNQYILLPLYIASAGIIASILGIIFVRVLPSSNPQSAMNNGVYLSAILLIGSTYFIVRHLHFNIGLFWAVAAGLFSGLVVGWTSEFYTSARFRPVRELSKSAKSGPAVVVVNGLAVGMESTLIPVLMLSFAVLIGYFSGGIYGVALASLGMLSILGITLSVDSYGPIADNAGGIAQMSGLPSNVREITDKLDAVGNTTAAIGKGFAIGSAAFAALGLFAAYVTTIKRFSGGTFTLSLTDPKLLSGLLIGGMIPFFIASLLARGVGRVANKIIDEVRRQFKEIPGLIEGKGKADSKACVSIATMGALKSMILPGIIVIIAPVIVGFLIGPVTLAGMLMGALTTGLVLGIFTANSGAAMDNAKKHIEEGFLGGKGTDAHKASIVGDTVGDPLKDTVGPSINILIKLMTVISLVLAPLFKIRGGF